MGGLGVGTTLAFYADLLFKDFSSYCGRELQKLGLTVGLLYYVLYVGKNPGCSSGQVCQGLHMDAGHTTRSVDRLVKLGFMVREKNGCDRRETRLRLTERGEQAFLFSCSLFEHWDQEMLSGLEEEEQKQLKTLLKKMVGRKWECVPVPEISCFAENPPKTRYGSSSR